MAGMELADMKETLLVELITQDAKMENNIIDFYDSNNE